MLDVASYLGEVLVVSSLSSGVYWCRELGGVFTSWIVSDALASSEECSSYAPRKRIATVV